MSVTKIIVLVSWLVSAIVSFNINTFCDGEHCIISYPVINSHDCIQLSMSLLYCSASPHFPKRSLLLPPALCPPWSSSSSSASSEASFMSRRSSPGYKMSKRKRHNIQGIISPWKNLFAQTSS